MESKKKRITGQIIAVAFWVTVWFIIAYITDNKLLVASPLDTILALGKMLSDKTFYLAVGSSMLRILGGFLTGLVTATVLSVAAVKYEWIAILMNPVVSLCKTMPVAAFVVILLIWCGPQNLAFIICFIIVFPGIYINMVEGIKATDKKLIEMAVVHNMPVKNRIFYIYRPAVESYLKAAMKNALGMCWKSGIAAEIIGMTNNSIGGSLYEAKIYFDTAGVFACAAVVIILSVICEKIIMNLSDKLFDIKPLCNSAKVKNSDIDKVVIEHIDKAYGEAKIYTDYSAEFGKANINYLNGPSGSGKTTLLKMIAGIEKNDTGVIKTGTGISMVFQEDRLCEQYSAVKNVALVTGDESKAREALSKVLDSESIDKPCCELSGGMKRRVAVVRAVEAKTGILLLDEPFTGMDEQTIIKVRRYIEDNSKDRIVIMATHI